MNYFINDNRQSWYGHNLKCKVSLLDILKKILRKGYKKTQNIEKNSKPVNIIRIHTDKKAYQNLFDSHTCPNKTTIW